MKSLQDLCLDCIIKNDIYVSPMKDSNVYDSVIMEKKRRVLERIEDVHIARQKTEYQQQADYAGPFIFGYLMTKPHTVGDRDITWYYLRNSVHIGPALEY